jgi:hypothetical protein
MAEVTITVGMPAPSRMPVRNAAWLSAKAGEGAGACGDGALNAGHSVAGRAESGRSGRDNAKSQKTGQYRKNLLNFEAKSANQHEISGV